MPHAADGESLGAGSAAALVAHALEAIRQVPDPNALLRFRITDSPEPGIDIPPGYVHDPAHAELHASEALSASEIEHWLLMAQQDPQALFTYQSTVPEGYVGGVGDAAARTARRFIYHWFGEIQAIVCDEARLGAAAKTADLSSKTVATSLAVWLASTFGMTSPVAVGLATVILLVLGQATKNAFCRMTRAEVVDGVTQRLDAS